VHLCTCCDQFRVVARISQARAELGAITVLSEESKLYHAPNCSSGPSAASLADMLVNKEFVQDLLRCTHNNQVRDLARLQFGVVPSDSTCTYLRNESKNMLATDGYAEDLRSYMEAFCAVNPGSTMQVIEDPVMHVFQSLLLIPAQSYRIAQYAGRTYYCLDAGHTNCQGWRGKIYILVGTDGEHRNIPLAMGIYPEETIDGYTDFLQAV
jgi:hypothetical protein